MVVGFLLSSATASNLTEVESISFSDDTCHVKIAPRILPGQDPHFAEKRHEYLSQEWEVTREQVLKIADSFKRGQELHGLTGAAHAALIQDLESEKCVLVEDVGRQNAVDKAIGLALDSGVHLGRSLIFVTGRLTSEMVTKAVNVSFPIMCSLAVATDTGAKLAKVHNITLLGAFKKGRFRSYNAGRTKLLL
jgi:FdhD protein